jgi:hypothetical protein
VRSDDYQLIIRIGDAPQIINETSRQKPLRIVHFNPDSISPEALKMALSSLDLVPSDFRTKVLVLLPSDTTYALASYSALVGFAGRRLDVSDGSTTINAVLLDKAARQLPSLAKPQELPPHIQVGAVLNPSLEVPSISFKRSFLPEEVAQIKYARRLRFVGDPVPIVALGQFLLIAALRARDNQDRFPYLVKGDEPAIPEEDFAQVVGICLDTIRFAGIEARNADRLEYNGELVPSAPLTPHQKFLITHADDPISKTMLALGASIDPETDLWHCPRPQRHSNGDKNASMRIEENFTQCFRCDSEKIDSLRLVMDTLDLTPDEAIDWLTATL